LRLAKGGPDKAECRQTEGSHLPGLNLQGAKVDGSIFLREGFHALGKVRLSGYAPQRAAY